MNHFVFKAVVAVFRAKNVTKSWLIIITFFLGILHDVDIDRIASLEPSIRHSADALCQIATALFEVDSEEVAEVDLPREGPFVKDLRWHEKY